jgi:hypothetical protein
VIINGERLAFAEQYLIDPKCLNAELGSKSIGEEFSDFPFREHRNLGTSCIKEESLLSSITKACEKSLSTPGKPVLLLSSGKDSLSLALGFAELGISVDCVSLVTDDEEGEYLKDLTSQLGHSLHLVGLDQIRSLSSKFADVSLCSSEHICLDQALFPMYLALENYASGESVNIIDGMGNDIYFGHVPAKYQINSYRYGTLRNALPKSLGYYLRNFTGAMGLRTASSYILGSRKEMRITNNRYADFINLKPNFSNQTDIIDARSFIRGKYIDNFVYAEKTRVIGRLLKCNVSFPWMDQDLANYCFNLPKELKYNFDNLENKILLRKLLKSKIGYNRPKKGIDVFLKLTESEIVKILRDSLVPEVYIKPILKSKIYGTAARKRALFEQLLLHKHRDSI